MKQLPSSDTAGGEIDGLVVVEESNSKEAFETVSADAEGVGRLLTCEVFSVVLHSVR